MLAFLARPEHLDDAEAGADRQGAAKELLHLFGPGVGGDVVILRNQARATHRARNRRPRAPECPAFCSFCTTEMANSRSVMLDSREAPG